MSRWGYRVAARSTAAKAMIMFAAGIVGCGSNATSTEPADDNTGTNGAAWSLGTLRTTNATDPTCPPNSVCRGVEVSCPAVTEPAAAFVAVANPTGTPRGVVVLTTGGGGETWALVRNERTDLFEQLRSDGFVVIQVRWAQDWLESSPGNDAGTAHLGCRPATVFKWIHETYFAPLGIARSTNGRCGFCITGNSGGSTQVSYALSHYGLESILDGVIPTGGPPHSVLAKACLRKAAEEQYWYADDTRNFIDRGFGFFDGNGPCRRGDALFTPRWNQESIATGGNDYVHPRTRVDFILGANDENMVAPNSDYVARLRSEGSPWVTLTIAANTPHSVLSSDTGRALVRAAVLATR